jgi:probable selenium-dependent hydroxylase accessory protein YqeC
MTLCGTFGVSDRRAIHLIGAGGKTTLMYALAAEFAASGRTVVTTTSTKIREPQDLPPGALVLADSVPDLTAAVAAALVMHRRVTVGDGRLPEEGKLRGLPVAALEALIVSRVADVVLVEADGAKRRSLKAHAVHEPVIAPSADGVLAVIGADVLGRPATDEHVHRAELFRARLGLAPEHAITPADIAAIVFHRDGWLARVPAGAEVSVFVRGTDDAGADAIAGARAAADHGGRLARITAGNGPDGPFRTLRGKPARA